MPMHRENRENANVGKFPSWSWVEWLLLYAWLFLFDKLQNEGDCLIKSIFYEKIGKNIKLREKNLWRMSHEKLSFCIKVLWHTHAYIYMYES